MKKEISFKRKDKYRREGEEPKKKAEIPQERYLGKYVGDIREKMKRPEVKEKWLKAVKGNLFNFKTGKYATHLPYFCNNCYARSKCKFYQEPKEEGDIVLCQRQEIFRLMPTEFDYREKEKVAEVANRLVSSLLERIDMNLWFEVLGGGRQDKALTNMIVLALNLIIAMSKIEQPLVQVNVNKQIANTINLLDEDSKNKITEILQRAAERSGLARDIIPPDT